MLDPTHKIYIALLLVIYTLLTAYIGYRNRRSESSEEYFLASRRLPSWLLAVTFIASWWGGGSAVDLVDQANQEGLSTFWIYGVPVLIATLLMFLFAGAIRRIGTISQPQLIEARYDRRTAMMLTIFIIIFMVIGAAVQVIVIGNFFQSFFGFSYDTAAILGVTLVLVYSLFGGFRGVVLTDLLQFVFFLFSSILLFVVAWRAAGGFDTVAEIAEGYGREGFTSFFENIENNLAYIITFGTSWMIQANVWQRISAAKSPASARKMMAISFVVFIPLYLIVTLTGMLSIATYESSPEGGIVSNMLLTMRSPMVGALIFIGLCSAIMSTMDSMFNTGALSLTEDIYKRYIAKSRTPRHYVTVGRISTVIIALAALLIGTKIKSVLTISWIGADFLATGAFVPLVLGFLWRRGTAVAAFCSMIFGLLFSSYNLAVALGAELPTAWRTASAEQAIVGIASSALIFVIVSLLSPPNYEKATKFIERAAIIKPKR